MNRRNFLKTNGLITGASLIIPSIVVNELAKEKPIGYWLWHESINGMSLAIKYFNESWDGPIENYISNPYWKVIPTYLSNKNDSMDMDFYKAKEITLQEYKQI